MQIIITAEQREALRSLLNSQSVARNDALNAFVAHDGEKFRQAYFELERTTIALRQALGV